MRLAFAYSEPGLERHRGGPNAGADAFAEPVNRDLAVADAVCDAVQGCVREATVAESDAIKEAALAEPEWTYTQGGAKGGSEPERNVGTKHGDCTDFTMSVVKKVFGDLWPHPWTSKINTGMFRGFNADQLRAAGYARISAENARPGDIVVRGGHAGIYLGRDAQGRWIGEANNGYPAYPDGANRPPYQDKLTGSYNFSPTTEHSPQFFRPVIPIKC